MDSRRSLLNYEGLDASRALAFFEDEAQELDEESLFLWMRAHPFDDLVVLDVTASGSWRSNIWTLPAMVSM
ncbi:Aspartokinase II/homoserine dehydrogenase II [Serratia fonticola]|uniref:Aspartokinase II/homoserine dehydrogenase II n=1 Tax=Serratia fonticola TaxID=47917 RepID=A0A4U9TR21_SERFO|nr:Aspartokinase II/homoserine dehydrogenase II [Serratia fonticola]